MVFVEFSRDVMLRRRFKLNSIRFVEYVQRSLVSTQIKSLKVNRYEERKFEKKNQHVIKKIEKLNLQDFAPLVTKKQSLEIWLDEHLLEFENLEQIVSFLCVNIKIWQQHTHQLCSFRDFLLFVFL
jgi:hypothetical protein